MLKLALITRNTLAAQAIDQIVHETDHLRLAMTLDPAAPAQESQRAFSVNKPELILIDLADWELLKPLLKSGSSRNTRWIGFAADWDANEELTYADHGVCRLLREPFGPKDLERAAFEAFHAGEAEVRPGLWAFLPAKAGAGCSTVVLNTARILQQTARTDVLLMETDIRSGCFSLLMDVKPKRSIADALEAAGEMTTLNWRQFHLDLGGVHILPADPANPGRAPSWVDYVHLLRFLENRYKHIFADLPDAVDEASAEVVRRAESVFVVCTPEIPSLKLTEIRCEDLLKRGVPRERIQLIVTRHKRDELPLADIEKNLGWPVYASIANDYRAVRNSILEAQLVAGDSLFGKDCRALAHKLSGLVEEAAPLSRMERLSRLIGK